LCCLLVGAGKKEKIEGHRLCIDDMALTYHSAGQLASSGPPVNVREAEECERCGHDQ